jgi:hypothetical protein
MSATRTVISGLIVLLAASAVGSAADQKEGAVVLSRGGIVPQNPSLPQLKLNPGKREQIRRALLTKHTEVEFKLKSTKAAKDFTPKIGSTLPKGVKADGVPSTLTQLIPQLADYGYVKMKDQILILNELTGKIVDIIPETQPQTTGQN